MLSSSRLSPLQEDFLRAFFRETEAFFLTGGAALVGFYDLPRVTEDLDLFSESADSFPDAHRLMQRVCASIGAECGELRAAPYFKRYEVQRGNESVRVDLAHEPTPQLFSEKRWVHGIRLDPLEEIFANKIATLVGRAEVRDFWDVYQLVRRGMDFEQGLRNATAKEGGVDAESVVFVLQGVDWSAFEAAATRAGLEEGADVAKFFTDLARRLALGLLPPPES